MFVCWHSTKLATGMFFLVSDISSSHVSDYHLCFVTYFSPRNRPIVLWKAAAEPIQVISCSAFSLLINGGRTSHIYLYLRGWSVVTHHTYIYLSSNILSNIDLVQQKMKIKWQGKDKDEDRNKDKGRSKDGDRSKDKGKSKDRNRNKDKVGNENSNIRQRQKQRQRENWGNAGQGANGDKCRKAHSSILKFKLNLAVSQIVCNRKLDGTERRKCCLF